MNEGSLVRRTLIVTGALVGVSTVWVALVSVVLVTVVGHVVSPTPSGPTSVTVGAAADARHAPPAPPGAKPNG
jgi:hypothetical protein